MQDFVDGIVSRAESVQDGLARDPGLAGLVGSSKTIPRPFIGRGPIRLVIIGQDPTVQKASSRTGICTVLNKDQRGPLRSFLERLCRDLEVDLDSEVYGTNLAKGFFTDRPTTIRKVHQRDVLSETSARWLPLLRDELAQFPSATVVSLGEPVLPVLVAPGSPNTMKHFWGWQRDWTSKGVKAFSTVSGEQSVLGRAFFPFVHQPCRGEFYRARRDEYLRFVRTQAGL